MTEKIYGYNGIILDVDLSLGKIEKKAINPHDLMSYVGGRGLGIKILWDRLKDKPGADPLGPENPLMLMAGPFSGFPAPSSSRTCVVTKSPHTSPKKSQYAHASTLSFSNMGGFFGPELRFAGYDGLVITGKAAAPVYLYIDDDKVEIRDAKKFWGTGTDQFDKDFESERVIFHKFGYMDESIKLVTPLFIYISCIDFRWVYIILCRNISYHVRLSRC